MRFSRQWDVWALLCLSLVVRLAVAVCISRPGYMDVAYYAAGAVRLAQGGGLSEPFLWNYLDNPIGLPRPGFLYWMPLPSLLASVPASLFPDSFFALQLPAAFLAALLPLATYGLAWWSSGQRRVAWVASLLTVFSGYFFPYWTLPETFAPFALFGYLALWLAGCRNPGPGRLLLVGVLAGLAHLTRVDGVLLLPVVALGSVITSLSRNTHHTTRGVRPALLAVVDHLLFVLLGYFSIMAPWFLRNFWAIGAPLSPGGTKTLWLRTYDDLFCYGCDLSLRSYLSWGWWNILRSKLGAAGVNAARFLAEDCMVFLFPFALVGLYRRRQDWPFLLALLYLGLVYLIHSLAFTYPGPRGGFFHASAPVLPFLFTAGVEGLEVSVGWVARRRRWNLRQARLIFATAAVVAAVALSGTVALQKVRSWRDVDTAYMEIGTWLSRQGIEGANVMVGNPPAFWYHTGYPSLAVPNGDLDMLLSVADRYGVSYVVLDQNRPEALVEVYEGRHSVGLVFVRAFDGGNAQLYRRTAGP